MEFNGTNHLILKEDDIVGILETEDIKDLKPLNDRVLIKVGFCYFCIQLSSCFVYPLYISGDFFCTSILMEYVQSRSPI